MKNETVNQIDSILSSLDQVKRASAPDYFYTRLKGRMQREAEQPVGFWLLRPVSAVTLLLFLLSINAFLLIDRQQETVDMAVISDSEYSNAIASEYRLHDNLTFYENGQEIAGK